MSARIFFFRKYTIGIGKKVLWCHQNKPWFKFRQFQRNYKRSYIRRALFNIQYYRAMHKQPSRDFILDIYRFLNNNIIRSIKKRYSGKVVCR